MGTSVRFGLIGLLLAGCTKREPPMAAVDVPVVTRPANPAADLNAKGMALLAARRWAEAERVLADSVAADPNYGPARNNLGVALYRQAKYFKAFEQFQRAVELTPASADAWNNLGTVREDGERYDDAVACFDRATALAPNDKEYFCNAAKARVHRGDRDDATVAMLRKVAADDDRPEWNQWAREQLAKLRP